MKKLKWKKCIAVWMLSVMLLCTGVAGVPETVGNIGNPGCFSAMESRAATDYGLKNPRVEMLTRDVIEFGSYWQEEYIPKMKIDNPINEKVYTDSDGTEMIYLEYTLSEYDDSQDEYVDITYKKFFKKSPIKWQILEEKDIDGDGVVDDLFLMSDQVLDCKPYDKYSWDGPFWRGDVSWESCSLRTWLNSDFYKGAFSSDEKAVIKETLVTNEDANGKKEADTEDKLYLLSLSELANAENGLSFCDQDRIAKGTDYIKDRSNTMEKLGYTRWGLRSGSADAYVAWSGRLDTASWSDPKYTGVRPVIHVDVEKIPNLANGLSKMVALKKATWDTIEFGNYNDIKITWRVLSVENDIAFLLADRILLKMQYNDKEDYSCTWETSSLRTWLNNNFYKDAFTEEERKAIVKTFLQNNVGNNTLDNVYLLSIDDIINDSYGFPGIHVCDSNSRVAIPTNVDSTKSELSDWSWGLRSIDDKKVVTVDKSGAVWDFPHPSFDEYIYIRPALRLDLSSSVWTKGEEVTSDDKKIKLTDSLPGEEDEENNNSDDTNKQNDSTGTNTQQSKPSTIPAVPTSDKSSSNTGVTALPVTNNILLGSNLTTSANDSSNSTTTSTKSQLPKVKKVKALNKKGKKLSLSWKKVKNATAYQVKYTTDQKMKKKIEYKTVSKNKATLSKLKKKTYYIQIRAMQTKNSVTTFGAWSAVKKVKVKK